MTNYPKIVVYTIACFLSFIACMLGKTAIWNLITNTGDIFGYCAGTLMSLVMAAGAFGIAGEM